MLLLLKLKHKGKYQPWVNDSIRILRQKSQQAERRWKKHKLQVYYDICRESLLTFQKAARCAKNKYYSDVISQNANNPKILFKILNAVINPVQTRYPDSSSTKCEEFLNRKIVDLHSKIPKSLVAPSGDLASACCTE